MFIQSENLLRCMLFVLGETLKTPYFLVCLGFSLEPLPGIAKSISLTNLPKRVERWEAAVSPLADCLHCGRSIYRYSQSARDPYAAEGNYRNPQRDSRHHRVSHFLIMLAKDGDWH